MIKQGAKLGGPLSGKGIVNYLEPFLNSIPGGFLMIDEKGTIVTANSVCCKMFGYSAGALLGNNLSLLLPEKFRPRHSSHIKGFYNTPHSRPMGSGLELYGRKKNGKLFPIEVSLGSYNTDEGMLAMAFIADITPRVEAENELNEERNFVSTLLETVSALIIVQDTKGRIIRFNRESEKVTGYSFEEVRGKTPWKIPLVIKEEIEESKEIFDALLKTGESTENEIFWKTRDGDKRLILWNNTILKNEKNEVQYIIKTGVDITESKNMERNLLNAVMTGQENERTRLSRELHDGLAPVLSSVKNNLEVVAPVVEELAEKHRKYFNDSMYQLNNAMDEIRTMSKDLMPRTLEDFGLVSALAELAERIERSSGIGISFYKSDSKKRFHKDIEKGLYRISQELLNNAVKHSNASNLRIQIVTHKDSIVLSVEDNGKGFNVIHSGNMGLGLKNITSRVKSLNGFVDFDSRPGVGTLVTIEIPLK